VHTPKVLFSEKLNGASQRLGALRVLYGIRCWRMLDAVGLLVSEKISDPRRVDDAPIDAGMAGQP
jgi:hypothetical protein